VTSAQRKKLEAKLLELLAELTTKSAAKIEPNRTDDARAGGDEDEQPLNEMLQSIASGRNKNAGAMLIKVQKALRKLKAEPDEFGLCEECGEEIALPRLNAMPYVDLCIVCQSEKDSPKGRPTRSKLTDYR
jgi:DnaK suppressor protein